MRSFIVFLLFTSPLLADNPAVSQQDLFVAGKGGYAGYRIPSLLKTPKGTLLAFCEARKKSLSDTGHIDVVMRRSLDGGKTWEAIKVIATDGENTVGNPCPVVDRKTGVLWMLLTQNLGKDTERAIRSLKSKGTRRAWVMKSEDEGATWTKPADITKDVKKPNWTWYATGPGVSIQLKSGRMIVPCDHTEAKTMAMRSHVIYSDDSGTTWKLGGVLGEKTNECQIVELRDGTLLLNMRSYAGKNRRAVATSKDGGLTWSELTLDATLIEPVCQASLIRLNNNKEDLLLFSNPASKKREKMTIRLSRDGGKTWPVSRVLHEGPAAYSCLAELSSNEFACLYERGDKTPYAKITFARVAMDWLK